MHLLLALDQGFEQLAAAALTSYLLHQRFESVVLVTPKEQRLNQLEAIAEGFGTPAVARPGNLAERTSFQTSFFLIYP